MSATTKLPGTFAFHGVENDMSKVYEYTKPDGQSYQLWASDTGEIKCNCPAATMKPESYCKHAMGLLGFLAREETQAIALQGVVQNPYDDAPVEESFLHEALEIDPFDSNELKAFDPENIDLEKSEYVLGKVLKYQTEIHASRKAAEAFCAALRAETEARCAIIMESSIERSEGFVKRMNALIRCFGLSIKAQCIAAINKSSKRSYKFASGVGVAGLRTNTPRIKLVDDKDMEAQLVKYAAEYVPGALRYTYEPLSHESSVKFKDFAEQFNTAGVGVLVDVKVKLDRRELMAALELHEETQVDKISGIITDTLSVAIKGTDGLETVPESLVIIKPKETFTLATTIGEVELPEYMESSVN